MSKMNYNIELLLSSKLNALLRAPYTKQWHESLQINMKTLQYKYAGKYDAAQINKLALIRMWLTGVTHVRVGYRSDRVSDESYHHDQARLYTNIRQYFFR